MSGPFEVHSEPGDGVLAVVMAAQKAVLEGSKDPIGVLSVELSHMPEASSLMGLGIEAAYGEHHGLGVIQRLDVHVAFSSSGPPDRELVAHLLRAFGGTQFTSICLIDPVTERELVDATLHFSPQLRYFAECTALIADELSHEELPACQRVLSALGLRCTVHGSTLKVGRRQLRGVLTLDAQLNAFEAAVRSGIAVQLYAATLPVTHAARIAARPLFADAPTSDEANPEPAELELVCTLSRKLSPESTSAALDAVALRDFVVEHFDFDFGERDWRVTNAHGDRAERRSRGPLGERRPLEWSLNFGAKRR
jgi:hypothetical protein